MFKKAPFLFIVLATFAAILSAEPNKYEKIGPGITTNGTVTIATPGDGKRNCITDLTGNATSYTIIRALNGTSTFYMVHVDSRSAVVEHWQPEAPLCADYNSSLTLRIYNTNSGGTQIETTGVISYSGYVHAPGSK
jgi:hypothetical protein